MVTVKAVTHPGLVRRVNEDGFFFDVELGLFLVADGMGGHNAGEIASRQALESIEAFVRRTKDDEEFTWPFGVETELSFDANRLRTALRLANRRVFQMSESGVQIPGMGTTVVSAIISKGMMTFATVGDSRLYLVKDHAISRLTVDDSWLATLRAQDPAIDEAQFERHPLRHVITKAIGTLGETELRMQERRLEPGDLLMMCTDGLHDLVGDDEMLATLDTEEPLEARAQQLVDRALARGGRDNVTVLVLRFDGPE